MAIHERPVRILLREMIDQLAPTPDVVFTRQDALNWVREHYPKITESPVTAHLLRFSTNARSRYHYSPALRLAWCRPSTTVHPREPATTPSNPGGHRPPDTGPAHCSSAADTPALHRRIGDRRALAAAPGTAGGATRWPQPGGNGALPSAWRPRRPRAR